MLVTSTSRPRPFPWRTLDRCTRAEAGAFRDVKLWASAHVRLDRLAAATSTLVGAELDVLVGRVRPGLTPPFDDGVAVVLGRADAMDRAGAGLVEAEGALAAALVARALRRAPDALTRAPPRPSSSLAAAFGAVVVAAARRAHPGAAVRIFEAGSSADLQARLARAVNVELVTTALTVLVDQDAFAARVVAPRPAAPPPSPGWDPRTLAALGPLPLTIPIVACATRAAAADLATLRAGDAFVPAPGNWPLARIDGGLAGPVALAAAGAALALRAELVADGRLVLRGGVEPLLPAEAPMDPDEKDAMATALGDVPVVVRVEIGEATMAARDWASLGRGDVVALGRRVGEPVVLRVGEVALARGELVDLEGEVAVRILERAGMTAGGA